MSLNIFDSALCNTLNKYVGNLIICIAVYKTALLVGQINAIFPIIGLTPLHFTLSSPDIRSRVSSLFYMDFPSSSRTRGWSAFASPPWICNTSSNTNRPSQMPSPKSKHTHTWACAANKCDETQIYWHTITCARHGNPLREGGGLIIIFCFFPFYDNYFRSPNILRVWFPFQSFCCSSLFSCIRHLLRYSHFLIAVWYIFPRNFFVINEDLSPVT